MIPDGIDFNDAVILFHGRPDLQKLLADYERTQAIRLDVHKTAKLAGAPHGEVAYKLFARDLRRGQMPDPKLPEVPEEFRGGLGGDEADFMLGWLEAFLQAAAEDLAKRGGAEEADD